MYYKIQEFQDGETQQKNLTHLPAKNGSLASALLGLVLDISSKENFYSLKPLIVQEVSFLTFKCAWDYIHPIMPFGYLSLVSWPRCGLKKNFQT